MIFGLAWNSSSTPWCQPSSASHSMVNMAMPEMPVEIFVVAVEALVSLDLDWVPHREGTSLYMRPFMIATQPTLGFTLPSQRYLFCVIASPSAPYFVTSAGLPSLTVWLSDEYSRAAPGGTGAAKAGGNYAAAFLAQRQAVEQGCDQVVWLDAVERRWVEEMGGMNLFLGGWCFSRVAVGHFAGTLHDRFGRIGVFIGFFVRGGCDDAGCGRSAG